MSRANTLRVRVQRMCFEAEGVTSYELVPTDGANRLPAWAPGAHIDVQLPSGTVRQYSLCGDPDDAGRYRIAVLEQPRGRGGSVEVHASLRPGMYVQIGSPRESFNLVQAPRYVFVAGGIGITPLLPMIHRVHRAGRQWQLVYGARDLSHMAFLDELTWLDEQRVRAVAQDVDGLIDVALVAADAGDAEVYCCGPEPLIDAVQSEMARAGRSAHLHVERFGPAAPTGSTGPAGDVFQVELLRSGVVVDVPPEQTVLDAVRAAGVDAPSSCEMGICGTCETKVLSGTVDHRDELLTEEEKAGGSTMLICVSRAACPRLVLDL